MSMKLSSDKEHLVLDNQRLVHYLVRKLMGASNFSDYEDIVSIGTIGLIKAAIIFDASKNVLFSSYATECIHNEIFMYYRKAKKYAGDISINAPIHGDGECEGITLLDNIVDPNSNFIAEILDKEMFIELVMIILNCLKGIYRIALLYLIANVPQYKISEKINYSQSYISRIQRKAIKKVQEIENKQVHYKEVFSMRTVGDEYSISFSSKEISKFNKIFATFLQNLTSVENLPDFKVSCNTERVIIKVPAHSESFAFIAQIIQEIDDFSMSFVSNKNMVHTNDTGINKFETDGTYEKTKIATKCIPLEALSIDTVVESGKESVEVQISEQIMPTLTEIDEVDETNSNSTVQKENQTKQIREYMLSMNSFTVKDLKLHFPNLHYTPIRNALYTAKRQGLITSIDRGKYVVNKN